MTEIHGWAAETEPYGTVNDQNDIAYPDAQAADYG
jgi:hypothetical protein